MKKERSKTVKVKKRTMVVEKYPMPVPPWL